MKKILFLAVAAVAICGMSSCKKTSCTCTYKEGSKVIEKKTVQLDENSPVNCKDYGSKIAIGNYTVSCK